MIGFTAEQTAVDAAAVTESLPDEAPTVSIEAPAEAEPEAARGPTVLLSADVQLRVGGRVLLPSPENGGFPLPAIAWMRDAALLLVRAFGRTPIEFVLPDGRVFGAIVVPEEVEFSDFFDSIYVNCATPGTNLAALDSGFADHCRWGDSEKVKGSDAS